MSQSRKAANRQDRRADRRSPYKDQKLVHKAAEEAQRKEAVKPRGEPVRPLTDGQRAYDAAFKSADIIYGIGPARVRPGSPFSAPQRPSRTA